MPAVVLSAFLSPFLGNLLLMGLKYSISTIWEYEKHRKESLETLKKDLSTLEEDLTSISKMNPIQIQIEYTSDCLEEIEDFFYSMYDLRDKPKDLTRYFTKSLGNVIATVAAMKADLERKRKDMEKRLAPTHSQRGSQRDFRKRQNLWVNDKGTIVQELTKCTSCLLGVTIVGISGSGKTELAKAVIEDGRIKNRFAYTCSPSPFTDFDSNNREIVMDEIDIVKKDIDPKKSERVLIFLDGLQKVDPDSWSIFRSFCDSELHPESKVLVTTQNPEIANATGSFKHCLPKLCDKECFKMIQYFARSNDGLSNEDETAIEGFEKVLVQKCMGLPLLAKHIGLLLSKEGRGQRVNTVREKLFSDLWMLKEFASVLGNLKLVALLQENPLLKWCLNYCSLFPPNNDFNKDLLVQLWMAEGLNRFQKEEDDFNDLLSHSIFQSSDNKETYEMHQLAYDFAQNVSSRAFYRKDINDESTTSIDFQDITYHFSLSRTKIIEEPLKTAIKKSLVDIGKKCKRLRTFLLVQKPGNKFLDNPTFFTKLDRLRVLDLSYTNLTILSEGAFSALGYLRYLDLSSTDITKVPSLSKNPALQVLKLNNCQQLTMLPTDLEKLTNLSYLQLTNTAEKLISMPPRMGQLIKLRELELFPVGNKKGYRIEELKKMNGLRKSLQIAKLEFVKSESEAREAELINKRSLETLELRWTADSPNTEATNVLKGLVPPRPLNELRIINYSGSEFPQWLSNPDICGGLKTIFLDNCKGCSELPSLAKLGLLQHVHLKRMTGLEKLPALPSSVKTLIIQKSDALKQHCLNGEADWRKIRGIRVTIDGDEQRVAAVDQAVPHQSSSIQSGDLPAVNDSDSRGLHEDCRTPSRMDASRIVGQLDSINKEYDSNGQNIDSGETDESRKKGKQKLDKIASSSQVPHRDNQHRDENYPPKQTKDPSNEEHDSNVQNIESGRQQSCGETDEGKKNGKQKVDESTSYSQVPHTDNQHRDKNYFGKQTDNGTLDDDAHRSLNDEIQHVQVHQNEVPIDENSPSTPPTVDGEGSTTLGGENVDQLNADQLQSTIANNTTTSNGDDRLVHQNEVLIDENPPSTPPRVDGESSTALGGENVDQVNSDQLQSITTNNTTASNGDDQQVHQNEVPIDENSPSTPPRVDGEGSTTLGGENVDQLNADQLQSTNANNTTTSNGDDRLVHQNEVPIDENLPSTPPRVDGESSTALGGENVDQVNSDQLQSTTTNNTTASNGDDRQVHQNEVTIDENSPSTPPRVDGEGSTALGAENADQVNSDQIPSTTANNSTTNNGDDRQVRQNEVPTDENFPSTPPRVDGEGSTALGGENVDQVNSSQLPSTTANNTTTSNVEDRQERRKKSKRRSLVGFLSKLCGCVPKEHGKEISSENLPKHM